MSDLKTQENDGDVLAYLEGVPKRLDDSRVLLEMMERLSGCPPKMWGDALVGFGAYEYTNTTGKPARWMLTGFAPRKAQMSIYVMNGFSRYAEQLERLGKHKHSVSCLYVTRLANIDLGVLEEILTDSLAQMRETYGAS